MNKTIPSQDLIGEKREKLIKARRKRDAKLKKNPTCSHCGETKTFDDFPANCVDYYCTECRREYARQTYHKKRENVSDKELRKITTKRNKRQNYGRARRLANMTSEELTEYKNKVNAENKARRDAVRDEVFQAYGGYKCVCCGETEVSFLSIDHINNDGASHRRENNLRTGEQMHLWLRRNNFPSGFQILCMNCQWGKRNNNGVCPHQSSKV